MPKLFILLDLILLREYKQKNKTEKLPDNDRKLTPFVFTRLFQE